MILKNRFLANLYYVSNILLVSPLVNELITAIRLHLVLNVLLSSIILSTSVVTYLLNLALLLLNVLRSMLLRLAFELYTGFLAI